MIEIAGLDFTYEVRHLDPTTSWTRRLLGGEYRAHHVIKGLDLEVTSPGITALLGKNGAGKTTLMKILSGILTPTRGKVSVLGCEPAKRRNDFLRQIGVVFGQKRNLWPELSFAENLDLTRAVYNVPAEQARKRSLELIESFGLARLGGRPVKSFSLGEAMKAEIANTLFFEPRLLFLDEPTIGLDVSAQVVLREAIKSYVAGRECHIILTSHYMRDVVALADRVLFMENGRLTPIQSNGAGAAEFERHLEAALLGS